MVTSPNGSTNQPLSDEPTHQMVIAGAEPGHGFSVNDIAHMIKAMLFVASEPATINELAAGAELDPGEIERALTALQSADNGLVIHRHRDRISLATDPRFARQIRQFLGLDREAKLSSAALETLAIVAYRQPVTRSEIESVRGVDCSGVIATLHARGLIEPVSRRPTIGNPIQYGTTSDFLKHFGLSSLAELPTLGQINGQDGHDVLAGAMRGDEGSAVDEPDDDGVQPDTLEK